jgi:hypothetical protein
MFAIIEPLYYAFTPHFNWMQSYMKPSPLMNEKKFHDYAYANGVSSMYRTNSDQVL